MPRLLFGATIFVSAFLLFLIQPLVGRLLLPMLGGSAAVWTACLVFFQSALLGGYAWAHFTSKLTPAIGLAVHVAALGVGVLALPLAVGGLVEAPANTNPTLWLLKTLALAIGLPFVALASNAPTLQRWFRHTDDPDRADPYFLYSASNVGSLLGLFCYPLIVEPLLPLTAQRQLWSLGYVALAALVAACALVARRQWSGGEEPSTMAASGGHDARQVLRWVGLAFVPSSLTAGVTAYVSTELAPIPLLWVLPLGLYLLTFIQAFAGKGAATSDRAIRLAAMAAFPLAVWHVTQTAPTWVLITLHLGALYVIALLCHSRIYAERPPSSRLTGFYLWLAFGGALGGVFNALAAPAIFDTAAEYPLVLILSAWWLHALPLGPTRVADVLLPRVVAALALLWVAVTNVPNPSVALWVPAGQIARQALSTPRIRAVAAAVLSLLLVRVTLDGIGDGTYVTRSFFAVHRVVEDYKPGYRALIHGATLHGMQSTAPGVRLEPVTYFTKEGPIGQVFKAHQHRWDRAVIGVVGLGAGELASYATTTQRWTFFEIDPVVESVARKRFAYLATAGAPIEVALGDGRISIARSAAQYDLLVMDAFSSDAIPRHLLTAEAFAIYLDRLAPGGLIALHISNRFVDLEPPLARLADAANLKGVIQFDPESSPPQGPARLASTWAVLARSSENLGSLTIDGRWRQLNGDGRAPWNDEKADILTAIRWRQIAALHSR